jgi:hypothetical protein
MRATILASALAAAVLIVSAAGAAPVCETRDGESVRCGAPDAMPVGQILSPAERQALHPDTPMPMREVLSLIAVIGGLFALIALMPRFDGAKGADWDRQEDDDRD